MSLKSRLTGIGVLVLSRALPGVLMLLSVPLWLRIFGVEAYGLYSAMWATTAFSSAVASGWLKQAILRYAGDDSRDLSAVRPTTLVGMGLAGAIPPLVASVALSGGAWLTAASAFLGFASVYYGTFQAAAQRRLDTVLLFWGEILRFGLPLALTGVIAFAIPAGGLANGAMIVSLMAISTGLAAVLLWASSPRTGGRGSSSVLREFWAFGWPMSIWSAVSSLMLMDRLLISLVLGPVAAGVYAAVADLVARGVAVVIFPITMYAHPEIMRAWNAGEKRVALRLLWRYLGVLAALVAAVLILVRLFGEWGAQLAIGSGVDPLLLIVATAAPCLWQVALLVHKPMEILGRTGWMAWAIALSAGLSLGLNLWALPVIGILASAIAYLIAAALYIVLVGPIGFGQLRRVEQRLHGRPGQVPGGGAAGS